MKIKKRKIIVISAIIIICLILITIIVVNNKSSKSQLDSDESYNIDFSNLENAKIENDQKINIANFIKEEQEFTDIDIDTHIHSLKISNMKIWADKYIAYISFDITNTSDVYIPEFGLDIEFFKNKKKDSLVVTPVIGPELQPSETKSVTYESIIDITNAYSYKIS